MSNFIKKRVCLTLVEGFQIVDRENIQGIYDHSEQQYDFYWKVKNEKLLQVMKIKIFKNGFFEIRYWKSNGNYMFVTCFANHSL